MSNAIENVSEKEQIINFKKYLENDFTKTLNEQIALLNKDTGNDEKKINDKIDDIRKNVFFYRGMDDETHEIEPSILRNFENKKYNILMECQYIKYLLDIIFLNENKKNEITVDLLARMQHYNYKSRLIDVTFNPNVAIYMACSSAYNKNGKVLVFAHESTKGKKTLINYVERYHFSYSPSKSITKNLEYLTATLNEKPITIDYKNYDSRPVVIIDRNTFKHNSAIYDLRYDAQSGSFIFFLNPIEKETMELLDDLDNEGLDKESLKYYLISAKNKITFLYLLAKSKITHITMYPDKDISHEINKINAKLKINNQYENKKYLNELINECLNINFHISNFEKEEIEHVETMCHDYIKEANMIEFLLTDYLYFINYRKKLLSMTEDGEQALFNESIEILKEESENEEFGFLLIK